MSEQLSILDKQVLKGKRDKANRKRRWENAFQRWSNEQINDDSSPVGKCGYGSMCEWCRENGYGRPCVRALNKMCREKGLKIDYSDRNFERLWNEGVKE